MSETFSIGLILLGVGLAFWLVSHIFMRLFVKNSNVHKQPARFEDLPVNVVQVQDNADAVVMVMPGGKLLSINEPARQLFTLAENEPASLDRLVRRVRPPEPFYALCSAGGRASFVINGRTLEGKSVRVEQNGNQVMVITLQAPQTVADEDAQTTLETRSLAAMSELTNAMGASLDLESTIQAILSGVNQTLPADFIELTLWEPDTQTMAPYRLKGTPGGEHHVEMGVERYIPGVGLSGHLAVERQPLLIPNLAQRADLQPARYDDLPIRSYMGFPLMADDEFLGTLELASMTPDVFVEQDQKMVSLLVAPAATALRNALRFRAEQRRAAELSGLAQLAQSFSSVRDSGSLFARLVQSIVPLIKVEIVGFLIYDEAQRMLVGQVPYYGLPAQFLDMYKTSIQPGSRAEQMLLSQEPIISLNAIEDGMWQEMGWEFLARGAALRDTALIPLSSGGRMIGYLQASNHVDGMLPFSQDELRLLTIVANQAAPIIENATLVQQTRQRAQRAEALRRIASLSSSAATIDEILTFALQELSHLCEADMAAAFLLDNTRLTLQLHEVSLFGDAQPLPEQSTRLFTDDPQYPFTATGRQHAAMIEVLAEDQAIVPYYQQILASWSLASAVVVPLVVRNEGVGEIWIGSHQPNFFDQGDLQVVSTAAGQLAGVVERSYLVSQTDETLRRRVDQLTALTRINRDLSTSLDTNSILQLVYEEALKSTGAECGSLLLFEGESDSFSNGERGSTPVVRKAVGDAHNGTLSLLERFAAGRMEMLNIPDLGQSEFPASHEGVRSSLSLPVLYHHRLIAMLTLHSTRSGHFDDAVAEIAQSLAGQSAMAIGNAMQFERLSQRSDLLSRELDTLDNLFRVFQGLRANRPLDESLQVVAKAIAQATPFRSAVISICDPDTMMLSRVAAVGLPETVWQDLQSRTQPWSAIENLLAAEYQVGMVYYIPADRQPVLPEELYSVSLEQESQRNNGNSWDADDFLIVPLLDADGQPLGLISVDAPVDGRRPDHPTFQALELLGRQACLVIEGDQNVRGLISRASVLEQAHNDARQAAEHAQEQLPGLLHSNLEQTLSIQRMDGQILRIRSGLEIASQAGRQKDQQGVLETIAREVLTRFDMDVALIATSGEGGPRLGSVMGSIPGGARPEALFGQRNPLRTMLEEEQIKLISSVAVDEQWKTNGFLSALEIRSFICLPLRLGRDRRAAVLVGAHEAIPAFTTEDHQVFVQLINQANVTLQNLEFLSETSGRLREMNLLLAFNSRLTGLDPHAISNTLASSLIELIPHAKACWVGLWDARARRLVPYAAAGYANNESMLGVQFSKDTLPLKVFTAGTPRTVAEVNFVQDYSLSSEDLLLYRKATGGALPVSTLLAPVGRGRSIRGVVVLENFDQPDVFNVEDRDLAVSLAQQTALALENTSLLTDSRERAEQLHALTIASSGLTSHLSSQALINELLEQLQPVLPFDTATLWLRNGNQLSVADALGFADSDSRLGISVAVEDSQLFQEMIRTGESLCIGDIRSDKRFPSLLEPENLSWLGVPLFTKSQLIGVVALEKKEQNYYTPELVQIAANFAGQAAVALENARLFEESQRRAAELDERSTRLALLNQLSNDLSGSLNSDTILQLTAQRLSSALNATRVAAVMPMPRGILRVEQEYPQKGSDLPVELPVTPLLDHLQQSMGIFSTGDVDAEPELADLMPGYLRSRGVQSLLIIPLLAGANLIGWFWVQQIEKGRFSVAEMDLARTMCNQAAIAIQNARLFDQTRSLTSDLERRVEERTLELRREHQNTQTLLSIITELTASLDLDQVLHRSLVVLNQSMEAESSALLLIESSRTHYAGLPILQGNGNKYVRAISDWVLQRRLSLLVDNLENDARWGFGSEEQLPFESALAVPLILGEQVLGTMVLVHSQPFQFMLEQVGLVEASARQIAVALNNAELFNLIRDQAENLGSMLREQQIEASRSRAILEAVADGVLVTDEEMRITLLNASAERIMGLNADRVLGQPLTSFSGLFGKEAQPWMETIRTWSETPTLYENEEYAAQIELDDDRIVSVHMAPVIWRSDLLGTVSIFRDITQEVQVDRLKSEFITSVSHELRTPMTSIKGYIDILLMGAAGKVTPQQTHFLEIVKSNTERLSALVNDLLDISRIETGRVSLELNPLNLRTVAEDVVNSLRERSVEENRAIEFEIEAAPDLPAVRGDMQRVRQILNSLVTNGYMYTPPGGRVTVRLCKAGNEVQVDVVDTGIGLTAKDQKRIFDRFYRGDDPLVLASSGAGLGLALAKTLVEMQRGRIWFASNGISGEGSTFSFTLPLYQIEE